MMRNKGTWALTGIVSSVLVLGVTCTGHVPNKEGDSSAVANDKRVTSVQPLSWLDDSVLLFTKSDRLSTGESGRVLCPSSGLYRVRSGIIRPWKIGNPVCAAPWLLGGASVAINEHSLIFANVFKSGHIYLVNLDDLSEREILGKCLPAMSYPTISPNGKRVAFVANCKDSDSRAFLHIANLDGSGVRAVTPGRDTMQEDQPSWAPDEKRVVLVQGTDARNLNIAVVDAATGLRHVIARGNSPSWSPSGEWIVYLKLDSTETVAKSLNLIRPDGADDKAIVRFRELPVGTNNSKGWLPTLPIWTKDGNHITFGSGGSIWEVALTDSAPRLLLDASN